MPTPNAASSDPLALAPQAQAVLPGTITWLAAIVIAIVLAAAPVMFEQPGDLAAEQATADSIADARQAALMARAEQRIASAGVTR